MKKSHKINLAPWQMDPSNIKTTHVQLWLGEVMYGVITAADAKARVASKKSFVMCDQAIMVIESNRHVIPSICL